MASKEFEECLVDVYQGELTGEVAFEQMLRTAATAEQKYILGTMLQFETEGKAMLRPLLMRFGLELTDGPSGRGAGDEAGQHFSSLPWVEQFAAMREVVMANYLPRYEELATLITADEDAEAARVAAFMGQHERALVELATNVISGHPDPAAPVARLLHFPLPAPDNKTPE